MSYCTIKVLWMCKITPRLTPPSHLAPCSSVCPFFVPMAPARNSRTSTKLWLGVGVCVVVAGFGLGVLFCFSEIDASDEVVGSGLLPATSEENNIWRINYQVKVVWNRREKQPDKTF